MKTTQTEIDPRIAGMLNLLSPVPPQDPQAAAQARANYLAQAEAYRLAVSPRGVQRHKKWIEKINPLTHRKEYHPMFTTLITIVLGLAVLFGGAGGAVQAAQGSLPGDLIYPVKTWSEEVRMKFTSASPAQISLALQLADRRMAEITTLAAAGKAVPAETFLRFQEELQLALRLGAELDNSQMIQAMTQIRLQAEAQLRVLQELAMSSTGPLDPLILQIQAQLGEQARLAGLAAINPDAVRDQIRERDRDRDRLYLGLHTATPPAAGIPQATPPAYPYGENHSYGPGPEIDPGKNGNAASYGPGPYPLSTGSPNSNPGTGSCPATCTPALDGSGPGPGPNAGPGQDPTAPGGAGSGPGPQPVTPTCTPVLDGSGPGPGPGPVSGNPSATPEPPGGSGSGSGQGTPAPVETGSPTQNPGNGKP